MYQCDGDGQRYIVADLSKLKPSYVSSTVCAKCIIVMEMARDILWQISVHWNLHMYLLQFVPNVSVRWRWPEVYCGRSGWLEALLISIRFNTWLITLWFTLLQPFNLLSVKTDECCTEASDSFDVLLQSLYMLFLLSWLRLVILCCKMSDKDM